MHAACVEKAEFRLVGYIASNSFRDVSLFDSRRRSVVLTSLCMLYAVLHLSWKHFVNASYLGGITCVSPIVRASWPFRRSAVAFRGRSKFGTSTCALCLLSIVRELIVNMDDRWGCLQNCLFCTASTDLPNVRQSVFPFRCRVEYHVSYGTFETLCCSDQYTEGNIMRINYV